LLEALLAVDGASLGGLEGDGRLLPALGTGRGRLYALSSGLSATRVALALTVLAALGFVLEVLVGVEELLARGPYKWLVTLDAYQTLVSVLHGFSSESGSTPLASLRPGEDFLLGLAANLFPVPFPGQGLLRPSLVTGFQVETVLLDVLDDIFLLNLPFESAEGVLNRLALLELDLGQNVNTP
jgi:hypothetical protein